MGETASLVVAVVALAAAALGRLRRFGVVRRLQGAFAFVAVAALASWGVALAGVDGRWELWTGVALLLSVGYLLARAALLAVFEWLLVQRVGVTVPRLARDVAALVVYLLVAAAILRHALDMEVGALLATSAAITAIVGLAMQETLGTLLAGLTLAWEHRLPAGEWLEIEGTVGSVEELGWRTLALRTVLGEQVLIPNSQVARGRIRVLGQGRRPVAVPVRLGVAYSVPPHQAKAVLLRAAGDSPLVLADPGPRLYTVEFADSAVVYEARLWTLEPWREPEIRDGFLTRAHAALARAGMEIPFPQRVVTIRETVAPTDAIHRRRAALSVCSLFGGLPDAALGALASASAWLEYAPGEAVVREGEASAALYVVARGEAVVERGGAEVARIGAGEVFGEMAFLSGAPRTATVRAATALSAIEVDSHALGGLLAEHAELAEELASRMAEREQHLTRLEMRTETGPSPRGLAGFLRERLVALIGR
ncbi:MAG: cyclic nucleotide-binding domain-containing protein [Acidobacteriota bacterium]